MRRRRVRPHPLAGQGLPLELPWWDVGRRGRLDGWLPRVGTASSPWPAAAKETQPLRSGRPRLPRRVTAGCLESRQNAPLRGAPRSAQPAGRFAGDVGVGAGVSMPHPAPRPLHASLHEWPASPDVPCCGPVNFTQPASARRGLVGTHDVRRLTALAAREPFGWRVRSGERRAAARFASTPGSPQTPRRGSCGQALRKGWVSFPAPGRSDLAASS